MGKAKTWLVVAIILIFAGSFLFVSVMMGLNWDFSKLSTEKYETNEYEICDEFHSIRLLTDTADVAILPSEDTTGRVVCYERVNEKHSVEVVDGTLSIRLTETKKWYEYIGISFDAPKITVYLPHFSVSSGIGSTQIPELQPEYIFTAQTDNLVRPLAAVTQTLQVTTSTGDIHVENIFAGEMILSVSTGQVAVNNVNCQEDAKIKVTTGKLHIAGLRCKNFLSDGSTGDVYLKNVIAEELLSVARSTGDVKFDGCDAEEIFVDTDTGNVTGTLLTEKIFWAETDTGYVTVPSTATGGLCEIETDTGDIKIRIE